MLSDIVIGSGDWLGVLIIVVLVLAAIWLVRHI